MDDTQPNAPRDVLRDGNLKSTIWRNESEKGPFYSVSITRTYKDKQGEPRDSHSFASSDLLRVSELARKAYDRSQDLRREDRQTARDGPKHSDAPLLDRDASDERRDRFKAERAQSNHPSRQPTQQR